MVDTGNQIQERGFAAPACAHQRYEFALFHIKRHIIEWRNRFAALVVSFRHVTYLNERHCYWLLREVGACAEHYQRLMRQSPLVTIPHLQLEYDRRPANSLAHAR